MLSSIAGRARTRIERDAVGNSLDGTVETPAGVTPERILSRRLESLLFRTTCTRTPIGSEGPSMTRIALKLSRACSSDFWYADSSGPMSRKQVPCHDWGRKNREARHRARACANVAMSLCVTSARTSAVEMLNVLALALQNRLQLGRTSIRTSGTTELAATLTERFSDCRDGRFPDRPESKVTTSRQAADHDAKLAFALSLRLKFCA